MAGAAGAGPGGDNLVKNGLWNLHYFHPPYNRRLVTSERGESGAAVLRCPLSDQLLFGVCLLLRKELKFSGNLNLFRHKIL
ncbi:hypothetical protein Y1Q_0012837 [Alligator mississippiensis]|uniref:Uncharacterized protein n=1 Tax=Alligator mississippiensis TaxID=8496 RepID=A0A151P4C5_ALLMI|nr:hypothetical protein Y1Q_0012837 [Alligator mississippiensis]